jgi:non-specific serine/threonine protein kinase
MAVPGTLANGEGGPPGAAPDAGEAGSSPTVMRLPEPLPARPQLGREQPGRYQLRRELARGGQGVVHAAWDTQLGREVAFKQLLGSPGQAPDGALTNAELRFVREARITAQLDHPGIAPLHEVGLRDDGSLFATQRLVPGRTLAAALAASPDLAARLELLPAFASVCRTMAFAHRRGVIHRDLKPDNVMVPPSGEAVVLDWGLGRTGEESTPLESAQPVDSMLEGDAGRTREGVVLGTPAYMSPEQVAGLATALDARSDVWSLGVILYQLLTGRRPFDGASASEVLAAVVTSRVQPVLELCPQAPPRLVALAERALLRDPAARPADAGALSAELEAALGGARFSPGPARGAVALPRSFTPLVGREAEVGAVTAALAASPLVTVTGPGGTGKTRLAVAAAEAFGLERGVRLAFVDVAVTTDPAQLPRAAALALQLRDLPGDVPVTEAIVDALRDDALLVVLDNCEHLVGACAALASSLVAGCRGLRLLATSQLSLGVTGEVLYRLAPLAAPPEEPPPDQAGLTAWRARYPALELLVQRLSAVEPDFQLDASQAPHAAEICRRLDGLPLALELVAPRLQVLSLKEIAEQLEQRFQLLSQGDRTLPLRQQGLTAVLEWSYGLLSQAEKQALERLSVFAGTFGGAAASAVCAPLAEERTVLLDLLQGLVDKSFVIAQRAADGGRRFRLLETVRQYAARRLAASGEQDDARARLLRWAIAFSESPGRPGRRWHELVGFEYENLQVAFEYAQGRPDHAVACLRLVTSLWPFWLFRGYQTGTAALQRGLAVAPEAPDALRAEAQVALAVLAVFHREMSTVRAAAKAGLGLARALGDEGLVALALVALSWAELFEHAQAEAASRAEEAIEAARRSGVRWVVAYALHAHCACATVAGEPGRALREIREALTLVDEAAPALLGTYLRITVGLQAHAAGAREEAREAWGAALADSVHFSVRRAIAGCLEGAAYLQVDQGAWAEAARLLGAAERIRVATQAPLFPQWAALHAEAEGRARAALGPAFDRERQFGITLPFEEVVALGTAVLGA